MKKLGILALVAILFASCTDYYTEERIDFRDRLTGRYEVEEYSNTYGEHVYYEMYVEKDHRTSDGLYFRGFYLEDLTVLAYLDGSYLTLPSQITDGYEVEGHGTYSHGDFHLYYSVRDLHTNALTDYCETVAFQY